MLSTTKLKDVYNVVLFYFIKWLNNKLSYVILITIKYKKKTM